MGFLIRILERLIRIGELDVSLGEFLVEQIKIAKGTIFEVFFPFMFLLVHAGGGGQFVILPC